MRLRFVTTSSAVSVGIRAFEYGFWASHVEAVLADGYLGAHADGGVQVRPFDYDKGQFTKEAFYTLPSIPQQDQAFEAFLRMQVGKPYDLEAIAGFVLDHDWRENDSWFCSELQAAALETAGWFHRAIATEISRITPRDLLLIVSTYASSDN